LFFGNHAYFYAHIAFSFTLNFIINMPLKSRRSQAAAQNIAKRWKQQENLDKERSLLISTDDGCNKGC
jgi:hypothetical protein